MTSGKRLVGAARQAREMAAANAEACRVVADFQHYTDADARGMVMRFSRERPMVIGKRLHDELKAIGFLDDPEIASRIFVQQPLPTA